jgi:hypothetical protein
VADTTAKLSSFKLELEPRIDMSLEEKDDFLQNFGEPTLEDIEQNQLQVCIPRMVILESLIKLSQGSSVPTKSRDRKQGVKTVRSKESIKRSPPSFQYIEITDSDDEFSIEQNNYRIQNRKTRRPKYR